jgi:hypothetical protein
MPGDDCAQKITQSVELPLRKRVFAVIPVDKLDTDREIVYPAPAIGHPGTSGMPGTFVFRDVRRDRAITVDGVVRGHFVFGIFKMPNHFLECVQNGGMDDDRVNASPFRPLIEITGRMMLHIQIEPMRARRQHSGIKDIRGVGVRLQLEMEGGQRTSVKPH